MDPLMLEIWAEGTTDSVTLTLSFLRKPLVLSVCTAVACSEFIMSCVNLSIARRVGKYCFSTNNFRCVTVALSFITTVF